MRVNVILARNKPPGRIFRNLWQTVINQERKIIRLVQIMKPFSVDSHYCKKVFQFKVLKGDAILNNLKNVFETHLKYQFEQLPPNAIVQYSTLSINKSMQYKVRQNLVQSGYEYHS